MRAPILSAFALALGLAAPLTAPARGQDGTSDDVKDKGMLLRRSKLPVEEKIRKIADLFGFKEATVAGASAAPASDPAKKASSAAAEGLANAAAPKTPAPAPGERYVKELEDNKSSPKGLPVMILFFDEDSGFCQSALQVALNCKEAKRVAHESFLCLRIDTKTAEANGLAKKLAMKGPSVVWLTPGGALVARFTDTSFTQDAFLDLLKEMADKAKKQTEAERKAQEHARKEAERLAQEKAAASKADSGDAGK
jgi:hypothetical protein